MPARPIDCDLHPAVPGLAALMPYLDEMWRETVTRRGIDELNTIAYPANSPLTARADWRQREGRPASTPQRVAERRWTRSIRSLPSAIASTAFRPPSARTSAPRWRAR